MASYAILQVYQKHLRRRTKFDVTFCIFLYETVGITKNYLVVSWK